jgi:hypothetical protein
MRRIAWTGRNGAEAVGTPRLLRRRSERPCNTRAHKRDELAPPHRFPRAEKRPQSATRLPNLHSENADRSASQRRDVGAGSLIETASFRRVMPARPSLWPVNSGLSALNPVVT